MNKEAVIVMLDCNSTMGKLFTSDNKNNCSEGDTEMQQMGAKNTSQIEPQTRFQLGIDSVKMLLEQKVS